MIVVAGLIVVVAIAISSKNIQCFIVYAKIHCTDFISKKKKTSVMSNGKDNGVFSIISESKFPIKIWLYS